VPDEEQAKAAVAGIPLFDTLLFGRRTYELFEKFWSRADDGSSTAPVPHHRGERTKEHHFIAKWLDESSKVAFFQEPEERDLEKFSHRSRTRSAGDREH
jgi:hypothetical protein